jgi:hypothetical protein
VVRGRVLHQYKSHAWIGVGGHAGKEGFKGRQPPADAPMPTMGNLGQHAWMALPPLSVRGFLPPAPCAFLLPRVRAPFPATLASGL